MVARIGETMQTQTMPQWIARRGSSTLTVRAADINQARERCAAIGMREPSSIVLKTDPAADRRAAVRASRELWHCMACGKLSSIGDKPVRNPCRCADLGD